MAVREIPEGHEIRGLRFRVYPDSQAIKRLRELQAMQRYVWNILVADAENTREAQRAFCERHELIPKAETRRERFARLGLPYEFPRDGATEEQDRWREEKAEFDAFCQDRAAQAAKHAKKYPQLAYRKLKDWCAHFGVNHPYQAFAILCQNREWPCALPPAHVWMALEKSLYSKGVKRFRRRDADMSVRVRSGNCVEFDSEKRFGERRGVPFYNVRVKFAGITMVGRAHRLPEFGTLEGVALTQEADGWFASVPEIRKVRAQEFITGTAVGIDVGETTLCAAVSSSGETYLGPDGKRDRAFDERIAGRQAMGKDVGRLQAQARRDAKQRCYEVVRDLGCYELIFVEKLPKWIGQGRRAKSNMRMLISLLKERYGDRVREVSASYTSQECSQCGVRNKESWAYENGRFGKCRACGHTEHRDLNAARNILNRGLESLASRAA